ncbi:hypothetical protein QBC46DRAFT_368409 [Diplogelasinospora grovesii]|uniref:Uncharacterized protein n=1 Tax=Diplogelasinospora grovesii TaxID=303347 RepID=A0AAN6MVB1_9PEZI|nr:hypothetical protein QBC46DRAFT_368409 [Diplogelasinospora grovesii]
MANVTLNSQTFFTFPVARDRDPFITSFKVLISSDNESDYSDLDDSKSNISFPLIKELLRAAGRKDAEPNSVTSIDKSFSATPGAGGNSDAVELSVTKGVNLDDEQTCYLQRSLTPPSPLALPRPSSASPGPL